jgi:uncharacterized protein
MIAMLTRWFDSGFPMLARLLGLMALLTAPVAASGSPVYVVSKGDQRLFLGGAFHLLRSTDLPLPSPFDDAFEAADVIYFETDIAQLRNQAMMQAVLLSRGLFLDGSTLESVLSPEAWQAAEKSIEQLGLPSATVQSMRPWLFAITLTAIELQRLGFTEHGVDLRLYERARAASKPTGGLEPFEQHVEYLVSLGVGHESEFVLKALEELASIPQEIERLVAAWRSGDLEEIEQRFLVEMRRNYPSVYRSLIVERNQAWLAVIEDLLSSPGTPLVVVGAAHLPGEDGLIPALVARGYTILPLRPESD